MTDVNWAEMFKNYVDIVERESEGVNFLNTWDWSAEEWNAIVSLIDPENISKWPKHPDAVNRKSRTARAPKGVRSVALAAARQAADKAANHMITSFA
jgi:hypothetical protein